MSSRMAASACWCTLLIQFFAVVPGTLHKRRGHERQVNNTSGFVSHFTPSINGIIGHSGQNFSHLKTPEKREMGLCACATLAKWTHTVTVRCVHWPTSWMDFSYCWDKNRDFLSSSIFCFTERWLCRSILDCALELADFQLRGTELPSKTKGGGICFYTKSG